MTVLAPSPWLLRRAGRHLHAGMGRGFLREGANMTEIPDIVMERALARLSAEHFVEGVEESLGKGDYRLALVLLLAAIAQRRSLHTSLPALLKAAVAAEALLSPEEKT